MDISNSPEQVAPIDPTKNIVPTKSGKRIPIIISLILIMLVIVGGILFFISQNNKVQKNQQLGIKEEVTPTIMTEQATVPPTNKHTTANSLLANSIDNFYDEILQALTKELKDWDSNFIITDFDITAADTYKQAVESETQPNKYSYARVTVFSKKLQIIRYYWYNYGYYRGLKQDRQDETQELVISRVNEWPASISKPQYLPGNAISKYEEKKDADIKYYLHDCHYYRSDVVPQKMYWDCQFIEEREAKIKEYLYQADAYEIVIDASTNQFQRWQKISRLSPVGGR